VALVPAAGGSFSSQSAPVFLDTEVATVPTDPVPPPPPGDIITPDGYDLTQIAQQFVLAGGTSVLCEAMAEEQLPNTTDTSVNDPATACLGAEREGASVLRILVLVVGAFGTAVLTGLEAYREFGGSGHPAQTQPNPGQAPQPPQQPGTPGQGIAGGPQTVVTTPDDATVNELVRAWRQRITTGGLGTTSSAADTSPYTVEALRTAARECLTLTATAANAGTQFSATNPCRTMQILFPAGAADGSGPLNAYAAAKHDLDAITTTNPAWVQLNYMSQANKEGQVQQRWYDRVQYSAPSGCKGRPPGVACDEYPLYASTQGGPAKDNGLLTASLRPIDTLQNTAEGTVYAAMVNTGRCAMQSAPPAASGQVATGGTPFLVVPLPDLAVPSFFLC
jgi:hypothetical protein